MPRTCLVLLLSAHATVLADWSLDQVAARADLVIAGTVEGQRFIRSGGELITESLICVEETFKGSPVRSIILSQLGGREGSIVADVPGDAKLHAGEKVLLFTYEHGDGRRYLVGMSLGAYRIGAGALEQTIDVPVFDRRGVKPPPGRRSITIDDVRAAIERSRR